jgi:hypothetical protein
VLRKADPTHVFAKSGTATKRDWRDVPPHLTNESRIALEGVNRWNNKRRKMLSIERHRRHGKCCSRPIRNNKVVPTSQTDQAILGQSISQTICRGELPSYRIIEQNQVVVVMPSFSSHKCMFVTRDLLVNCQCIATAACSVRGCGFSPCASGS